jgi:hypothetical protein
MEARLQALLDRDEIRRVIMDFSRAVDRHDWELLRGCFHEGAHDDHGAFAGDAGDYVEWVAENLPKFAERTMHFVGNVIVDLDGPTVARAESYVIGYHRYAREDGTRADWAAGGRYLDRFEKRDGAWRIADRLMVWEWARDEPIGLEFESFGLDTSSFAWGGHGEQDPLYRFGR